MTTTAGVGVVEHNTGSHTVKSLSCEEMFNLSGVNLASACPVAFYLTVGSLYGTGTENLDLGAGSNLDIISGGMYTIQSDCGTTGRTTIGAVDYSSPAERHGQGDDGTIGL